MRHFLRYKGLTLPLAVLQLLLIQYSLLYRHSHQYGAVDILTHVHYIDYNNADSTDHSHSKSEYIALHLFSALIWENHKIIRFLPEVVSFQIDVIFNFYCRIKRATTSHQDIRGSPSIAPLHVQKSVA